MLKDIVEVRPLDEYRLFIRFEDGVEGIVDLTEIVTFSGVFAPLADRGYFAQVYVNRGLGTVCWPNHADLDPDVRYALLAGRPIPSFNEALETA